MSDENGEPANLTPVTQLVRFAHTILQDTFDGVVVDPEDIQGLALEHGLLVKTVYDPDKHGTAGLETTQPGEEWYVLSDWFKAAIQWR